MIKSVRTLLLTTLLGGCQTHAEARNGECDTEASIARSHAAWRAEHVRDYRFVWQQQCFCLADARQPIRVTVRNGEIVAATDVDGAPVSDDVRRGLKTIDELYDAAMKSPCDAAQVRVEATDAGVPAHIYVDPQSSVADDEFDVTVSEFVATAGD